MICTFTTTWLQFGLGRATFRRNKGSNYQITSRVPEGIMAKIIEFYIPKGFRKIAKSVPPEKRGEVIEFSLPTKTA